MFTVRGSLTVEHTNGQRYAANNLQVIHPGWGALLSLTVLAFECSGVLQQFPIQDIKAITVNFTETES